MARLIYFAITSLDGYIEDSTGNFDWAMPKATTGHDIAIGGPELASHAFRAGLIDECHLFLAPIIVGGGKPSIPHNIRLELELLAERRFGNGMVFLHYRTRS